VEYQPRERERLAKEIADQERIQAELEKQLEAAKRAVCEQIKDLHIPIN
jgi:hypothetical protein